MSLPPLEGAVQKLLGSVWSVLVWLAPLAFMLALTAFGFWFAWSQFSLDGPMLR